MKNNDKLVIHVEAADTGRGTEITLAIEGRTTNSDMLTILLTIGRAAELSDKEWLKLALAGVRGDNAVNGTIREEYRMGGAIRRDKET